MAQTAEAGGVVVTGEPIATPTPHDNFREMRQHIMPEVSGTEITVTKKATVIKLNQQPPVENNNQQELFTKAPGFQITEQQTPGQFNFTYRGLGNPQESEFTLVLRDGLPLMSGLVSLLFIICRFLKASAKFNSSAVAIVCFTDPSRRR